VEGFDGMIFFKDVMFLLPFPLKSNVDQPQPFNPFPLHEDHYYPMHTLKFFM